MTHLATVLMTVAVTSCTSGAPARPATPTAPGPAAAASAAAAAPTPAAPAPPAPYVAAPPTEPAATVEAAKARIGENIRDSVEALKVIAYADRAAFVAARNEQLATLSKELERITLVAERSTGTAKDIAYKAVESVRAKWVEAKKDVDLAERATEASWHQTTAKVAASYDALVDSLAETRTWAAEKIAP